MLWPSESGTLEVEDHQQVGPSRVDQVLVDRDHQSQVDRALVDLDHLDLHLLDHLAPAGQDHPSRLLADLEILALVDQSLETLALIDQNHLDLEILALTVLDLLNRETQVLTSLEIQGIQALLDLEIQILESRGILETQVLISREIQGIQTLLDLGIQMRDVLEDQRQLREDQLWLDHQHVVELLHPELEDRFKEEELVT
jgi:hypothetical protein